MLKCSKETSSNNMDQVMDIEKVNEFSFLNEEVLELTNRWSENLLNARSSGYLNQKAFGIVYDA